MSLFIVSSGFCGGTAPTPPSVGDGPFPLDDDGNGYPVKLTLPVNSNGELSGQTDAYEIFCLTSANYQSGQPNLEDYENITYFQRTADAYRMSSPIRPGAYTSSNTNGPARCEFRHERDYGPTERMRFRVTFALIQAPANSKCTCVQIHRKEGDPVIKGVIQVDSNGTTWKFRGLVKPTDGAEDVSFNDGLGGEVLAANLTFNTDYDVEYDYNPVAQTLKVWFDTANTETPQHTFTGVQASGLESYAKPGGPYPSNKGAGNDSDLWVVDVKNLVMIADDGSEVERT